MARTTKDTPEAKKIKTFIQLVKDMRRFQKLAANTKEPASRDKFIIKSNVKARAIDNALEKLAT